MKHILAATLLALALPAMGAESSATGTTAEGRSVSATLLAPGIVKVVNTPLGESEPEPQTLLPVSTENTGSAITLTVSPEGVLTIADSAAGVTLTDSGERPAADGKYTIRLSVSGDGSFYGGGERGHKVNLRGDTLVNYNRQNYGYTGSDPRTRQMNITMPLVLSSDGYALLFDDFAASTTILGNTVTYTTEAPVPVTYYYVSGPSLAQLTRNLTALTGRQPLPPVWAMGYINSKYGYKTPEETIATVDSIKGLGYPLDATVLDLYWFGKEQDMGYLDWDLENWPDPAGMMSRLKDRGVHLIAVTEPYILTNGRAVDNFNFMKADSMLVRTAEGDTHPITIWVGEGGMLDVANPVTRQWMTDRYRKLTDMGMSGWWGDLGEPEVHPETGYHANGLTARQYHNRYGNDWASIISDLFAEQYPDTRLMTLMRGGTTGLQRQSVFPWTTDVSRSWGGLEPQIRIMLHSGLSGLGYMSSDLGGFAVDQNNPYLPELYLRWLEAGLFTPVFRTHSQQFAEVFNYPQYHDTLLKLIRERYRWLPYNYTLAFENATQGWPLARPIDFFNGSDGALDEYFATEYLWGRDVLVAPVVTEGADSREVYFPAGSDWINANDTREIYRGGTTARIAAPLDVLPYFFRAGSLIPSADYLMENTGEYRSDEFTINYYPGPDATAVLFDDNHLSPASIADGQYRLLKFATRTDAGGAEIAIASTGSFPGAPLSVRLNFKVNCLTAPAAVSLNGTPLTCNFDEASRTVAFTVNYVCGPEAIVKIEYNK